MPKAIRVSLVLILAFVAGCNSFERNTYNTLASSKAVIDGASTDYEQGKIPQTRCAYSIINNARAADVTAVNAMIVYEQLKANKGNLTAQTATVTGELAALAPLVNEITALMSNPNTKCPNSSGATSAPLAPQSGPGGF